VSRFRKNELLRTFVEKSELRLEGGIAEWQKGSRFLLSVFSVSSNSEQVVDQVIFEVGSV